MQKFTQQISRHDPRSATVAQVEQFIHRMRIVGDGDARILLGLEAPDIEAKPPASPHRARHAPPPWAEFPYPDYLPPRPGRVVDTSYGARA